MKSFSSIFNDVLGPVMRGPSSSHTAASVRIGAIARHIAHNTPQKVVFHFNPQGSLATTYHSHHSDIGLCGGLLGMANTDERLLNALDIAKDMGMDIQFHITEYVADHPNTYKMDSTGEDGVTIHAVALSVGGGMIEMTEIEGFGVTMSGGHYETVIIANSLITGAVDKMKEAIEGDIGYKFCGIDLVENNNRYLINIKTLAPLPSELVTSLLGGCDLVRVMMIAPVVPVLSQQEPAVPFRLATELMDYYNNEKATTGKELAFWELATIYEAQRGGLSKDEVFEKMRELVGVMSHSIDEGMAGTTFEKRILGPQAYLLNNCNQLLGGSTVKSIIQCVTAIMEVKSSMGVIVAAPTAGSCGGVPGTIIGVGRDICAGQDQMVKAMLAAGLIGVFISESSTFAAEVAGCQAECGAGSGMAAAGLVQLAGGTTIQCLDAASMALQNIFGMVCDPVADRVEVPCLGKNVMAGMNALSCANMALCGYDKVIPLDETIQALHKVGIAIPFELRCTCYGGLSITPTSKEIKKKFD